MNKEYDENGNVIRYDSSYTYSWSGNPDEINTDSLMRNFGFSFNQGIGIGDEFFSDIPEFFRSPFSNFENIQKQHLQMMEQFRNADKMFENLQQQMFQNFHGQSFMPSPFALPVPKNKQKADNDEESEGVKL